MTELQKQVQRAQRRITLQRFLSACVWSLAGCLGVAAIALAVTKVWPINVDLRQWQIGWLVGSVLVGLGIAGVWAWFHQFSMIEAAIEIDRRFGLKERVSSSLSLSPEEAASDFGRALVSDAAKRVERIDVRDEFAVKANRWAFLPFATGILALAMVFLPDAKPGSSSTEAAAKTVEVKKVRKSTEALKKRLSKKSSELEEKNLKEASKLAKELEKGVDELSKQDGDKKKAMLGMKNLAKMLKDRRESMQGSEDLRNKLSQLKETKVKDGPADKLAKAMQNGDLKQAMQQLQDLQQQLNDGKLNPEQMEKLANQMQQMQEKMSQMVQQHEQQKKDLEEQIAAAQKQGNQAAAEKLQKKLDQLQAQNDAMKKMDKIAQKMEQIAKAMKSGDQQQANQQMDQLAKDLQQMQQEMEEMQALDEMMDQLASARDSMNCEACDGEGCAMCQGMGGFGMPGEIPGMGMNEGQGRGDRPEEQTDQRFYDSKVKTKVGKGKMVLAGSVSGPNKPGEALEAIKEAMAAAETAEENPLTSVRMPKAQLEQAQQYFDSVRDGVK